MGVEIKEGQDWGRLRAMRERIEEIERPVLDLKQLGKGMPVTEKYVCSILSSIHVLKVSLSDVAEITEMGGTNG